MFGTFCLLVSPKLLLQKNQYGLFRVSCRQDGKSTRKFLSIVCFLCHIRRAQYSPEWEEIQRGSDPSYAIRVGICSQVDWSTDLRRNIKQCCNCWITFTCSQKHHTRLLWKAFKRVHNTRIHRYIQKLIYQSNTGWN